MVIRIAPGQNASMDNWSVTITGVECRDKRETARKHSDSDKGVMTIRDYVEN